MCIEPHMRAARLEDLRREVAAIRKVREARRASGAPPEPSWAPAALRVGAPVAAVALLAAFWL